MPLKFTRHQQEQLRNFQKLYRSLPDIVGTKAVEFFHENFRRQGFLDSSLEPWPERRNREPGGRRALLIKSGRLRRSVRVLSRGQTARGFFVRVGTDVPYAELHNEGGTARPAVTPKMRKWAWAKYYEAAGKSGRLKGKTATSRARKAGLDSQAGMYKGIALTTKSHLEFRVPQRRFIGDSAELNRQIEKEIARRLGDIFK